jgi:hypothetical protein
MRKPLKPMLAALLAVFLLAGAYGCQPNPTVPPVVGKGDLEKQIKDKTPAPSSLDPQTSADAAATAAPQRVTRSLQDGKLIVHVDADVELPAVSALPVVKVSPRKFTQADVDNIVKTLLQGRQAYKPKETMSKDDIQKQLVYMQALKSQASGQYKENMDRKLDTVIASLQEQLKTAPDSVPLVPSDGKLATIISGDGSGSQELNVIAQLGGDTDANLYIYNSPTGRTSSVWFTNEPMGQSFLGTQLSCTGAPKGVRMAFDDAKALAEKTVSDLGADLKLAETGVCGMRSGTGLTPAGGENPEAWFFAFTREVNGVPTTFETDVGGNVPQEDIDRADRGEKEYIEPHTYERIVMAIADAGIVELQWQSPDTVMDTVSADAQTIPFDQAMETFGKQFFLRNALTNKADVQPEQLKEGGTYIPEEYAKSMRDAGYYTMDAIGYGDNVATCTFNIDRIVLGLSRIAVKDQPDEFLIVPVWDFFGTCTVAYTPESGYAGFTTTDMNKSFLTVNAIDGSVINRSYGY